MSEEAAADVRAEIEQRLVERSLQEEDFRNRLLEDPKATVERELGTRLPDDIRIRVVEEAADTVYLVFPSTSPEGQGCELSNREHEAGAGGGYITAREPCL